MAFKLVGQHARKVRKKIFGATVLTVIIVLAISMLLSAMPLVAATDDSNLVGLPKIASALNEQFDVDVMVYNISDVTTVNIKLTFDKNIVQVVSITEGSVFSSELFMKSWDNTTGVVGPVAASSTVGAIAIGTAGKKLCTIKFEFVGVGNSTIAYDADASYYIDSGDNTYNLNCVNSWVDSSAIPEFSASMILPLLMITTLFVFLVSRWVKTRREHS